MINFKFIQCIFITFPNAHRTVKFKSNWLSRWSHRNEMRCFGRQNSTVEKRWRCTTDENRWLWHKPAHQLCSAIWWRNLHLRYYEQYRKDPSIIQYHAKSRRSVWKLCFYEEEKRVVINLWVSIIKKSIVNFVSQYLHCVIDDDEFLNELQSRGQFHDEFYLNIQIKF